MKTILLTLCGILLIYSQSLLKAQTVSGEQNPCPGEIYRYKLNGSTCTTSVVWGTLGPGTVEIIRGGINTGYVDVKFPNTSPSTWYTIVANVNCPGGSSGPKKLESIEVKTMEGPTSTNESIICTKRGSQVFKVSGGRNVKFSTVQWTTNTGWPILNAYLTEMPLGAGYYMNANYDITNNNGGYVKVSYQSVCALVPASSYTWNITRSPDDSQPAPTVVTGIGHLCVNQAGTVELQPYPNAIKYVWSCSEPTMKINGQTGIVETTSTSVTLQEPTNSYTDAVVSVYAVNDCGRTVAKTFNISVGFAGFTVSGDEEVCPDGTSFYWVDPVGNIAGITYNWTVGGGTIQSGQGTYKIRVLWGSGSGPTSVLCRVGKAGCTPRGVSMPVEILDCFAALDFTVSPNPAKSNIMLQLTEPAAKSKNGVTVSRQIEEVRITDKLGNNVMQRKFGTGQKQASINIGHLKPDVYVIQLRSGKDWKSKQIIVQP
ncbi:T9SS type A sorting domain-containing protein [Chitinophaga caseinilytica]|uniref:T9SS type A sorting domain-containing protein n=1 Tax=Chitinophaga caseinilytica TaxID=2267521 RepID=A0ABZ2Z3L1_9BACT